jgi:hypothetical protein
MHLIDSDIVLIDEPSNLDAPETIDPRLQCSRCSGSPDPSSLADT